MNTKSHTIIAVVASLGIGASYAATITWDNGGADTNWNTGDNWSGTPDNTVPNLDGTDNALINNGDTVTYNPGADLDPVTGSTITVTGGSTLNQTSTAWQRMSGGTITLDNGTWTTASVMRVAYGNGEQGGTINLLNGASMTVAGEFWVARPDTDWTGVNFTMNISGNSSLDLNGGVGLWLWDSHLTGNDYNINFTGAGSIEGRIGYQNAGGTNNSVTWETLWNEGVLQWNGGNAGAFSDHFSTTGTAGTVGYTLIAVPEPSAAALVGLGGVALILRRRK